MRKGKESKQYQYLGDGKLAGKAAVGRAEQFFIAAHLAGLNMSKLN